MAIQFIKFYEFYQYVKKYKESLLGLLNVAIGGLVYFIGKRVSENKQTNKLC